MPAIVQTVDEPPGRSPSDGLRVRYTVGYVAGTVVGVEDRLSYGVFFVDPSYRRAPIGTTNVRGR